MVLTELIFNSFSLWDCCGGLERTGFFFKQFLVLGRCGGPGQS